MYTFFHQETLGNQFALTFTFQADATKQPDVLPIMRWLTFFTTVACTLQIFYQHPDADADHRLVVHDDVTAGTTTTEFHYNCGKDGRVVPRAATAPADNTIQVTAGVPWSLRVITTNKTADAFLDIGWSWEKV